MKRFYITLICFLTFNGCKQTPYLEADSTSIAKTWYEKQNSNHKLLWPEAQTVSLSGDKSTLIVPLDQGIKIGE
ncbi:hypothetical protein M1D52_07265 [Olivibacter sp. SA151]|uniref:hypothetical protein n=1 Tax=Olivibacter jilunii TaxID=985016 RepID=UPI003F15BA1E